MTSIETLFCDGAMGPLFGNLITHWSDRNNPGMGGFWYDIFAPSNNYLLCYRACAPLTSPILLLLGKVQDKQCGSSF